MILSHVRSKKLKVQTHTCDMGNATDYHLFDKSETVPTVVNNGSKHINNNVF